MWSYKWGFGQGSREGDMTSVVNTLANLSHLVAKISEGNVLLGPSLLVTFDLGRMTAFSLAWVGPPKSRKGELSPSFDEPRKYWLPRVVKDHYRQMVTK